jgi:hypothetical protein
MSSENKNEENILTKEEQILEKERVVLERLQKVEKVESGISAQLSTVLVILAFVLGLVLIFMFLPKDTPRNDELDSFTQCLVDNEIKMYGMFWCSHCTDQKKLFGDSFEKYKQDLYVECSDQEAYCVEKGIENTPTWIRSSDNEKLVGLRSLDELAVFGNCELPAGY